MTRPDKHAARFGDQYQPFLDWCRLRAHIKRAQPAIHRMTEAFRRYNERTELIADDAATSRVWYVPAIANTAAPTLAELQAGTPIRLSLHTGDDLERFSETTYTNRQPITWTAASGTFTLNWADATVDRIEYWNDSACGDIVDDEPDIIERIDNTLAYMTDAQTGPGDTEWPFRSF